MQCRRSVQKSKFKISGFNSTHYRRTVIITPQYDLKRILKIQRQLTIQSNLSYYLCKHRLSMLGDHGALITVHCDGGVVVWFFWVLEDVIQVCHTSFKDCAKITRNEGPSNCCWGKYKAKLSKVLQDTSALSCLWQITLTLSKLNSSLVLRKPIKILLIGSGLCSVNTSCCWGRHLSKKPVYHKIKTAQVFSV